MGMAASQARLLGLTARLHDIEYQAQAIQNAKLQLATQSDQVYTEYTKALDAQTLTLTSLNNDGSKSRIAANFNNLFSSNRVTPADGSIYALRNEKGLLVVETDVYNGYEKTKNLDAFSFAIYMLGGETNFNAYTKNGQNDREEYIYNSKKESINGNSTLASLRKALEEYVEEGSSIYSGDLKDSKNKDQYNETLENYRTLLYKQYGEEICTFNNDQLEYGDKNMTDEQYNEDKFNNYIDIYRQIQTCGGCVPISDYNGTFGDAANNSDWLTSMIQCGKFTIDTYKREKNGTITMKATSPSSDTSLSYTETTTVDTTAAKKAELKYEHDLKEINQKDKQFDLSLSKLESQRKVLTTEYDSVKKVCEENIDRSFKIFS